MTSSELHRKLLFCGHTELTDFLQNSPTNRYIYKMLIDLDLKVPALAILNEVYYQCIRVQCDGNPGEDVSRRYIDEGCEWLGDEDAIMLVLCLVLALIERKVRVSENEQCWIQHIMPCLEGHHHMSAYKDLVAYMTDNDYHSPYQFKPKPCPIDEIPVRIDLEYNLSMSKLDKVKARLNMPVESSAIDFNPWRKVTDNFSPNTILWYIKLYKTREDQLRLLQRITKACTPDEYMAYEHYFTEMERYIRMGDTVNRSISYQHLFRDYIVANPDEKFEYDDPSRRWNTNRWKFEELSKELAEVKQQCEKQSKAHEKERALMEAKYQSEIERLKEQLAVQSQQDATSAKAVQTTGQAHPVGLITLEEMVAYVKEKYNKADADTFTLMLYRLAQAKNITDESFFKLVDSIDLAVRERETQRQIVNIDTATQVNIGLKEVNNYTQEE